MIHFEYGFTNKNGRLTAEALRARSKEFSIKKVLPLCELCASPVK